MKKTSITIGLLAIVAVVLGIGPALTTSSTESKTPTQLEIAFFSDRVAANSSDIISATRLGGSLRQNQRETGDLAYLFEAETVLRSALASLPTYAPTQLTLSKVLIDLHRFEEGLALARASNETDPGPDALLTIADAFLAMGLYDAAQATYDEVGLLLQSPALSARQARLEELTGDLPSAITMMKSTTDAIFTSGVSGEPAAWYATRLGDLYLNARLTDEAESEFRRALTAWPTHAPAIAGLGDVMLSRGDLEAAIFRFTEAVELSVDPDWLFTLAYLHDLAGNANEAGRYTELAEATVDGFGDIHPRDFAIHYANSGETELSYRFARAALGQSDDVYAHDVMAWAHYRAGRFDEALTHSALALAVGTQDADLTFHHGAILLAVGQSEKGIGHIEKALEIGLDPWVANEAKELLDGA